MTERRHDAPRWPLKRTLGTALAGLALLFLFGVATGFLAARLEDSTGSSAWTPRLLTAVLALPAVLVLAATVAWWGRARRAGSAPADLRGPSERENHRLLALSGVIGGVMGLAIAVGVIGQGHGPGGAPPSLLTGPIPAWLAVMLALVWGVAMPIISWRWERVVDEHEREAYRDGAVAGFYVMGMGAPVWWLLWRGGLAPAVDAFWLYNAVIAVTGIVWLWRKYR